MHDFVSYPFLFFEQAEIVAIVNPQKKSCRVKSMLVLTMEHMNTSRIQDFPTELPASSRFWLKS